ncbi:MAG TPA: NAD(P)-dependent alcohol dehydrogenase [Devosia sp.]|nr:NAD(P)-dependent alcohol dehydrogenase [Devosia sp.]
MKAACIDQYGPPEVIRVRDVPDPVPGPGEVLIRQVASTVTPADCAFRSADPAIVRLFAGLTKPKQPIPGGAIAGVVEAVGSGVTRFRPGERVFGTTDPLPGAMAELVATAADGALVPMPADLDFGPAAGLTYSYLTAMPFLRDEAKLQPGQQVLINGAAGSIGTVAVQLAVHMGARVTAVCSTRNIELVRSLGAHEVIDRTKSDFTAAHERYDAIFDTVGKSSFAASRGALKPGGIYLTTTPSMAILFNMLRRKRADGKRAKLATTGLRPIPDKARDMSELARLIKAGVLRAVIDRTYPLSQIAEAHRYVETGTNAGDVIIAIGSPDAGPVSR